MGIITAQYDGPCDKCKTNFKKGDKICVEKGKKPLCAKCAPPNTKEFKGGYQKSALTTWDHFVIAAVGPAAAGAHTVGDVAKRACQVADALMAERIKRGIK